jgi:hypothetical protein
LEKPIATENGPLVRKAFKYPLYPTKDQRQALAKRKTAWEEEQRSVISNPCLAATNVLRCRATVRRVESALQAFLRRVQAGVTPGVTPGSPRFNGRRRVDSVAALIASPR